MVVPGMVSPRFHGVRSPETACGTGSGLGRAERRQEHASQDPNNRDDHQQFDEGECGRRRGAQHGARTADQGQRGAHSSPGGQFLVRNLDWWSRAAILQIVRIAVGSNLA